METNTTSSIQKPEVHPDSGKMLTDYFSNHSVILSKLAKQLKWETSSLRRYLNTDTMQIKALWDLSIALNHNFIAEQAAKLPVEFISDKEKALQSQIDDLQKQLEHLNIELAVYRNIVGK